MRVNEITESGTCPTRREAPQVCWSISERDADAHRSLRQATAQYHVKTTADVAGQSKSVTMLSMEWNSLMGKFKKQFGPDLCEEDLLAQTYHEEFEEQLAEGKDVVSQEETYTQHCQEPDFARQCGMHLDGKLALQAPRRFRSTDRIDVEQLRAKYTALENMWLLGQLRQPGRAIFKDLTRGTVENFLKIPPERTQLPLQERSRREALCATLLVSLPLVRIRDPKGSVYEVSHQVDGHRGGAEHYVRRQRAQCSALGPTGSECKRRKRNGRDGGKTGTGSSRVEEYCPSVSLPSRRRSRSHGEAHPGNGPSMLHQEKLQARTRREGVRERALGEEGVWDEGRQRAFQQLKALKFPAAAAELVSSVLIRCFPRFVHENRRKGALRVLTLTVPGRDHLEGMHSRFVAFCA